MRARTRQNGIGTVQTVGRTIVSLIIPDEVDVVLFVEIIVDARSLELAVVDGLGAGGACGE